MVVSNWILYRIMEEVKVMAKYLLLWELNNSLAPVDAKERGAAWLVMTEMIKQDLAEGKDSDWGCFVGEAKGYAITEQDDVSVMKDLQRFFPYVTFKALPVMSVDQIAEIARSLTE
jgi:hypothetical protein